MQYHVSVHALKTFPLSLGCCTHTLMRCRFVVHNFFSITTNAQMFDFDFDLLFIQKFNLISFFVFSLFLRIQRHSNSNV